MVAASAAAVSGCGANRRGHYSGHPCNETSGGPHGLHDEVSPIVTSTNAGDRAPKAMCRLRNPNRRCANVWDHSSSLLNRVSDANHADASPTS
jgi:hypothetical protein